MKKITIILTLLINGLILMNACKKDKEEPKEYDTQTSQDNSLAETTFNNINDIVNEAISRGDSGLQSFRKGSGENSFLSTCATVTVTPATQPATGGTITVDFGSTSCQCHDNRFRRGIINISYTGAYRDSGTVISIGFNNYFTGKTTANMFQVTGTKTIANKGHNSNGNINFDITVDGHLINSNGVTMDWSSTRNREWISGFGTYPWTDDQYRITGSSSGKNFEGNTFTVIITSPLLINLSCSNMTNVITQGVFELTPQDKPTRTLDYGDGTCDDKATITVNGQSFTITLR
jgi:hypothetical protein